MVSYPLQLSNPSRTLSACDYVLARPMLHAQHARGGITSPVPRGRGTEARIGLSPFRCGPSCVEEFHAGVKLQAKGERQMTDSRNGNPCPPLTEEQIIAASKTPLARTLYRIAKAQVERGARTLPARPSYKQPGPCETHEGGCSEGYLPT